MNFAHGYLDRDVPFCGGDCSATGSPQLKSILDTSSQFLQQAQPFEAYVVKGAGHGLALVCVLSVL